MKKDFLLIKKRAGLRRRARLQWKGAGVVRDTRDLQGSGRQQQGHFCRTRRGPKKKRFERGKEKLKKLVTGGK